MPKKGPNRTLKKPQVMIPDKHWVKKLKKYMNIPNPTVPAPKTRCILPYIPQEMKVSGHNLPTKFYASGQKSKQLYLHYLII